MHTDGRRSPIAEHLIRRGARHAHGHNHDGRARHYALALVRPSPARIEAPEPDVWLPIALIGGFAFASPRVDSGSPPVDSGGAAADITGELEALDMSGELELLNLEEGHADLDRELGELEAGFWSTAATRLEEAVARVAPHAPLEAEPPTGPVPGLDFVAPVEAPEVVPAAGSTACPPQAVRLHHRTELVTRRRTARLRRRIVSTALVVAILGAFAAVAPSLLGAAAPQRDVTITVDGHTFFLTTRAATVGELLAAHQVQLAPGDRVVPPGRAQLREGLPIHVLRAFPVDVDVDGATRTVRTTRRTIAPLRHELALSSALMLATSPSRLRAGAILVFRTPHRVTLDADGTSIEVARSTALDVAALLTAQLIALGARDEVTPALATRLANGMAIKVFRLADDQVAEQVAVPFTVQNRDDPSLPKGQTRLLRAGRNGVQRVLYRVTTSNGAVVAKQLLGTEMLVPPAPEVWVRGTKPPAAPVPGPPKASGSATWYETAPGTCAHLTLAMGTTVTLTNRATGATAQCRVADRGPQVWTGHIFDLAPDVFRRLAPLGQGLVNVDASW